MLAQQRQPQAGPPPANQQSPTDAEIMRIRVDDSMLNDAAHANVLCTWLEALEKGQHDAVRRSMSMALTTAELSMTAFVEQYPDGENMSLVTNVLARVRPFLEQRRTPAEKTGEALVKTLMRENREQSQDHHKAPDATR